MKKAIIFYSFVVTSLMTLMGFLGATSYQELVSAILFYPLAAYFWLLVLPKRSHALILLKEKAKPVKLRKETVVDVTETKLTSKLDRDRRMFLKLIGSAGLSVFLLAIFTKRAQAAFFGSLPGPGTVALKDSAGVLINPAERQPTDGYNITELDDGPTYVYGGFVNKDGAWFISRETVATGSYRYAKGSTNFSTNWANRASLTYDYFDNVF